MVIKAAKKAGLNTINILLSSMVGLYNKTVDISDMTITLNELDDIEKVVKNLITEFDVVAVTSFTDTNDAVLRAAQLNERYISENVFATSNAVRTLHDKFATRKMLDKLGMRNVKYDLVDTQEKAEEFFDEYGKMVLKPFDGQASKGVKIITERKQISAYIDKWKDNTFIAETVLDGKEYSVESITVNKKTYIVGVTEKLKIEENDMGHNPLVEKGHVFPAVIDNKILMEIQKYITMIFDNLDVMNIVGHSEIIITKEGPVLVESHIRCGGDCIPEIVCIATDFNMYEMHFRSMLKQIKDVHIDYHGRACIEYLILKQGKLVAFNQDISDERIVKNRLTLKPEMTINAIENSFDRTCGHIICKDESDPKKVADEIFDSLHLTME